jgi:hypothetical protein
MGFHVLNQDPTMELVKPLRPLAVRKNTGEGQENFPALPVAGRVADRQTIAVDVVAG